MTIQNFSEFIAKVKTLPLIGKILSTIAIVLLFLVLIFFSSCGTTRAVVTNRAESTTTTIKISTNNPTSVDASPDVDLSLTPNK